MPAHRAHTFEPGDRVRVAGHPHLGSSCEVSSITRSSSGLAHREWREGRAVTLRNQHGTHRGAWVSEVIRIT